MTEQPIFDDFRGDDAHLARSIKALINLNDAGALAPHGVGGHGRSLLAASAVRLSNRQEGKCVERCERLHPQCKLSVTRSIAPEDRWFWSVVMPDGHCFTASKSFPSLAEAVVDMVGKGTEELTRADEIWRRSRLNG